VSDSVKN